MMKQLNEETILHYDLRVKALFKKIQVWDTNRTIWDRMFNIMTPA
jgi:hypothetical protein